MDCGDRVDDRTFKVSFTTEGVDKLRERLKDKLKEILHDYTDDTLVEYVIVLIKNGRHKDEARNELNVFLGDCTNSFVSWLWDHLGSNLGLYIQPQDSHPVAVSKTKPSSGEQVGKNHSHQIDSESGKGKPKRESRSRHNREWKDIRGDAGEPPPLQSSETDNIYKEEKTCEKVVRKKRSLSPQPIAQKKRIRLDEGQQKKRELPSQAVGAPRRLLQFAVRDAVTTLKHSTTESLKHIRSVVSASTGDSSLEERPQRIRSIARVPNPMAAAIKAVAEAAEDVTKIRSSRNVFDRLGCGTTVSGSFDQQLELSEPPIEDEEFRDVDQFQLEEHSSYVQKNDYREQKNGKFNMLESDTRMASDYASDNETYDDANIGNRDSVARNAGDMKSRSRMDRDQPSSVSNTSSKIVNISVDVNTWKPPVRQDSRETRGMDNRRSVQNDKVGTNVSATQPMKENASPVTIGNENARPPTDVQREAQKSLPSNSGLYSTSRPTEDVDARIIFVNNVHFAATKDSLSRHFIKFGEVLKVVILTDAATAQPKGSAYVEFMRKESAEHALSLDGTSFMSRILKVVRKSSAPQEATATVTWPRVVRGSPFSASRFARVPFPRGISSIYRPRIPVKPGARSLQWTRDAQSTSTESSAPASTSSMIPSSTRSLTYVRPDPKANGNTGAL